MKYELFNDDCIKVMQSLDTGSIGAVITDPPYGMNFQSNRAKNGPRHKKIHQDDQINSEWITESYRILKEGGGLVMFCNWKTSSEWHDALVENGFDVKSQAIWNRMHHGTGDLTGAFAPMHDVIWYATKGRRLFANSRPFSVLSYKRPSPGDDYGHPTCKPVELMKDLIHGVDDGVDDVIFDPFTGSGSTGEACARLDKRFMGTELDPDYYRIAEDRIRNAYEHNNTSSLFTPDD